MNATTTEIERRAIRVIADNLRVRRRLVVPSAKFAEDLGADALAMVNVALGLGMEFGLTISDAQVRDFRVVKDAIDLIGEHVAQEACSLLD